MLVTFRLGPAKALVKRERPKLTRTEKIGINLIFEVFLPAIAP
jgi:hypothetical protein